MTWATPCAFVRTVAPVPGPLLPTIWPMSAKRPLSSAMAKNTSWFANGLPLGPLTVAVTTAKSRPSETRTSLLTVSERDNPVSDGPSRSGISTSCWPQPPLPRRRHRAAAAHGCSRHRPLKSFRVIVSLTSLTRNDQTWHQGPPLLRRRAGRECVCEIREVDLQARGGGIRRLVDRAPGVDRHLREHRHDLPTTEINEVLERGLELGLSAHDLQAQGRRGPCLDLLGHVARNGVGNVDALGVAAVGAEVAHAVALDDDVGPERGVGVQGVLLVILDP